MPRPAKGKRMGGSPAHERLILANLATALFEHGRITTTEARARRLRPVAERLVTFAKKGDLAARRRVLTVIRDKDVVHTLFAEIGPRFEHRPGGYTRIIKIGPRKGDNAPMAVIELCEALAEGVASTQPKVKITPAAAPKAAVKEVVAEEVIVDQEIETPEQEAAAQEVEAIETEVSESEVTAEEATDEEKTEEA